MNILFLTLIRITDVNERNIYTDLMRQFRDEGHAVYIVTASERRNEVQTTISVQEGITILSVKTLNIQKTNIIEKGVGTLLLEYQYTWLINKHFDKVKFDLILYSTPPITYTKVIKRIKERDKALSYLLLKDIFPQNAVDLKMIRNKGFLHKWFRKKEKDLYNISDYIGCMSPANVNYLIDHNPYLDKSRIEVCPNSINPISSALTITDKQIIRTKYNIPKDKLLFIYGGNLGKPQGIDFLLEVLKSNQSNTSVFFIIIGSGTEYNKVKEWFDLHKPTNSILLEGLPKNEYDYLLAACDVGLIFLDKKFTIPNYPSRLLSYLENKLPVILATDLNTDIGKIAEENKYGFWCENGELEKFNSFIEKFTINRPLVDQMGNNGYGYLIKNYCVDRGVKLITSKLKEHV